MGMEMQVPDGGMRATSPNINNLPRPAGTTVMARSLEAFLHAGTPPDKHLIRLQLGDKEEDVGAHHVTSYHGQQP